MRLQSKKLSPSLSPAIAGVFIFSLLYWLYLSLTTHMAIVCDATNYQELGRMLQNQGWIAYFKTGPNREPLYPLLVMLSMHLESLSGIAYAKIMAFFGLIILFLTQIMTYQILLLLKVRERICILVLGYLALSPALNNSAFSLYSEIATYPLILGTPLACFFAWEAIKNDNKRLALFYGMLLGILFALSALIKGVFEGIAPVFFLVFFATIFSTDKQNLTKRAALFLCIMATLASFYIPITTYKWMNWRYNGNFVLTNRAAWMIYGNTERRIQPLTPKKLEADLAFSAGGGFCSRFFSQQDCDYWAFEKTDVLGMVQQNKLTSQHLTVAQMNSSLIHSSVQMVLGHPFQYSLLSMVETLKMFFWESTQIGFVDYPHWLQKIYDIKIFNNGLRCLISLLSLIAAIALWLRPRPQKPCIIFLIGVLLFTYIFFFSFVTILTRYALPIAPLYLVAIALCLEQKLPPKKIK